MFVQSKFSRGKHCQEEEAGHIKDAPLRLCILQLIGCQCQTVRMRVGCVCACVQECLGWGWGASKGEGYHGGTHAQMVFFDMDCLS